MRLDGTMAADPSRCLSLLRATGPVLAPGLGTTLTSRQVVPYTTNTAYRVILDPEPRKRVLGDAAKATFDRFVEGTERPVTAVRSLADAVSEGHIQLHAADEQVQGDLVRARAGGALPPAGGDFLAVSVTNSAANKLDYYARRALSYRVRLGADRTASSSLLVQFENRAPPAGEPSYVVGPYPGASAAGEMVSYVSTFCGERCELQRHTRQGRTATVTSEPELGHRAFSEFLRACPRAGEPDWATSSPMPMPGRGTPSRGRTP